ncbi:MAG: tetratricopeptide repeat protein, partial [Thermodesulfobacteriota bacterium]
DDKNKGAAHRFNFGLRQARGEYVTYLGDDDLFYPNHLEVLARALDEHPEVGLAYSDLYAVSCVVDPDTGKRHVLDKRIAVSRDFNRQFMFHYNHVLHVSLMHRREAAFRVGCFDESVKVLIEWSLNRRLCFIYDFLHVPVVTGEYYMPVFKSDRISVVQRKDKDAYRHNLRKIRCGLPPEPWPKIDTVAIIYPVNRWDQSVKDKIGQVLDGFDHPFRFILVNNGTGLSEEEIRAYLGNLSELGNICLKTPPARLETLEAYRFGARKTKADYVFLITDNLQVQKSSKRLFGGLEFLKSNPCDAVKWDIPEERRTIFDVLLPRELFLRRSDPNRNDHSIDIQHITQVMPAGFRFDALFSEIKKATGRGDYQTALAAMKAALALPKGAPGPQFLVHYLVRICLALKEYDLAEAEVRILIERGYEPDNYLRLGMIMQQKNRPAEAIEAFRRCLENFKLNDEDFESRVFPFNFPKELAAFAALTGLGECYLETGNFTEAARMFHRASKLRSNSHKPFLGFAKIFLAAGQLDRAEVSLSKIAHKDGRNDPEVHRVLGRLCERRKRVDLAFSCYLKAFEYAKTDEKTIDPLYYAGASLGHWVEMIEVFEEFLAGSPGHPAALTRLASCYFQAGEYEKALATARKGLAADGGNMVLRSIEERCRDFVPDEDAPADETAPLQARVAAI